MVDTMTQRKPNIPYWLEHRNTSNGQPNYYLVKASQVNGKKIKTSKFIGHTKPNNQELHQLSEKHAYELETTTIQKEAKASSKTYKTTYIDTETLEALETIRYTYKKYTNLLTTDEIKAYEQNFEIHYVQGTTAIEGNTLTINQTRNLLVNEIVPDEKTLREINEIQNFKNVKTYRDRYKGKITLDFIKTLHSLIMNNIDYHSLGLFRRTDHTIISGCDLNVTPAILIEEELKEIINEYYLAISKGQHPFEEAVMFHYKFEMIHPFNDGNGRVGREIFNYMLNECSYPRLLFLGSDRAEYIKLLQLANDEQYGTMVQTFAQLIIQQRFQVLLDNLVQIVLPPKQHGQLRLYDFFI